MGLSCWEAGYKSPCYTENEENRTYPQKPTQLLSLTPTGLYTQRYLGNQNGIQNNHLHHKTRFNCG